MLIAEILWDGQCPPKIIVWNRILGLVDYKLHVMGLHVDAETLYMHGSTKEVQMSVNYADVLMTESNGCMLHTCPCTVRDDMSGGKCYEVLDGF